MLVVSLASSIALAAPCEAPVSTADLRVSITEAFGAFAENDGPAFEAAASRVEAGFGCLNEFLLPGDAAEVHRFFGLRAFYRQEPDYAIQSFQAALALQPSYNLPTSVAPQPGPLWTLYERAKGRPAPETTALDLAGYTVFVDGKVAKERPALLPYVVQFQAPDGAARGTAYVAAAGKPVVPEGLAPVAVNGGGDTGGGDPGGDALVQDPKPLRFGLDLGLGGGFRFEHTRAAGGLRGYGVRLMWNYVPTVDRNVFGVAPYLDYGLAEKWDLELALGLGGGVVGAAWVSGAAQWDPPSPFQANVGLYLGASGAGAAAGPELTIGWLW